MYQPAKTPHRSRKVQRLSRIESEHQRNQNRIRQLHRRNRELEEEMRHLSQGRSTSQPTKTPRALPKTKVTKSPSLRPQPWQRTGRGLLGRLQKIQVGSYSLLFWMQVVGLMIGVAIVSGVAGFLLIRVIASLVR